MRQLQHEAVLRLIEARHRDLPAKLLQATAQVQLRMIVLFDFAARMFLVGFKTAFDRLRPDDSVLTLICVLGRFDDEVVRDALKDLADQFWPGDAVGDGAVGVDVSVVGDVPVGEAREAVVLPNADPPVRAPELPDHVHRDFHGVVDDIVLADRIHAVDGQASISVETLVSVAYISVMAAMRARSTFGGGVHADETMGKIVHGAVWSGMDGVNMQ